MPPLPLRALLCLALLTPALSAETPQLSYLFPAGGQRGQKLSVRVGGLNLYDRCRWEILGTGARPGPFLTRVPTRWFEGPILPLPDSQRQEDYPQDMTGEITLAPDAPLGPRRVRVWTSEGASSGPLFQVGDLPEVIEEEIDGDPLPVSVALPVTINGRIFPREDVDLWSFTARKGQTITCEVHAARLNSPLDSRLELFGPDGRRLADNDDDRGPDSFLAFIAPTDGVYRLQIADTNRAGSQRHVYRLTLTSQPHVRTVFPLGGQRGTRTTFTLSGAGLDNLRVEQTLSDSPLTFSTPQGPTQPVTLDLDTLPEVSEPQSRLPFPGIANGRIERPGEIDTWHFVATKGQPVEVELRAARLHSPLRGVLELLDPTGKVIQTAEYGPADPVLRFTPSRDGEQTLRVREQTRSRAGSHFAYRLRIAPPQPDLRLHLAGDAISLLRGGSAKLKLTVVPQGGFSGAIRLAAEVLPPGVQFTPTTLQPGQTSLDLTFRATAEARIDPARVRLLGLTTINGRERRVYATLADDPTTDTLLIAVGLPVPFKVIGAYDLRLIPRGTVYRKRFRIERNGYTGPLEVRLADRQARHLQGVTGPTLTLPPNATEVDYPVTLPVWMETGRTSRACVLAIGRIRDGDREHVVGFSSQAQNEQMIAVVETGRLGLEIERQSLAAPPNGQALLPFTVRRGKGLVGPAKVELLVPDHIRDTRAEPRTLTAEQSSGTLSLRFGPRPGPYNRPLILRVSVATPDGPVTAEVPLELVAP